MKPQLHPNIDVGRKGERVAERYLLEKGFKFVAKNVRTSFGEIDLIMIEGSTLVIVEVKARKTSKRARQDVFSNIDMKKQQKLRGLASYYFKHNCLGKNPKILANNFRIDALGVIFDSNAEKFIEIMYARNVI